MFSDDGLHPSEPSQRRLAKIIAGALTPHVAARTSFLEVDGGRCI
jgi:lysophospholipase L1-like esterase